MTATFLGVDGTRALFDVDGRGVLVNTRALTASAVPLDETQMSGFWTAGTRPDKVPGWREVAQAEAASLDAVEPDVILASAANTERLYTIPRRAREAATSASRAALARTRPAAALARAVVSSPSATQVDSTTVRALHRYFVSAEHERGSAAWLAHGGDAGARWASSTVARNGLVAAAGYSNLVSLYEGDDDERSLLGVRNADGLFTDLVRPTRAGTWEAWFNGDWSPLRQTPSGMIELDDDSAVFLASSLLDEPGAPVDVFTVDETEADLVRDGVSYLDFEMLDRVLAAGVKDGYTEEERSDNASKQLRDANGKFAQVGDAGIIKSSGISGTVKAINPQDNTVIIDAEDGNTYAVPPAEFEIGGKPSALQGEPIDPSKSKTPPLNLDAILGQPRATRTTPKAMLKHLLPPMNAARLKAVVTDYEELIKRERQRFSGRFKGGTGWRESKPLTEEERRERQGLKRDVQRYVDENSPEPKPKDKVSENALAADDPAPVEKLTPETSDIKPLYLAVVDRDDPQAVTDLVAMIPATTGDGTTTTYRRVGGAWVEDAAMLRDIKSPTPPPIVQLDDAMYTDVLKQVDASAPEGEGGEGAAPAKPDAPTPAPSDGKPAAVAASGESTSVLLWGPNGQLAALVSAGGADRNRGGAEKLRRYWLYGPGAAKIRWNTGGDWKRCVRLLSKYLGVRSKGYCALRHKEATGMWTGDRRHKQLYGSIPYTREHSTLSDIRMFSDVLTASADAARAKALRARVYGLEEPGHSEASEIPTDGGGKAFRIPLLIPEGIESGDGRTFDVGSLSMRSLPLPLMWQEKTGDGHDGSYLVGRIDRVERIPGGLGNAVGVFDTGPWGQEAQRLVESRMLRWVSADLDRFEADEVTLTGDDGEEGPTKLKITKGRLMGATLVSKPAFQECTIELQQQGELVPINDGTYVSDPVEADAEAVVAAGSISMNIPVVPPAEWFDNPRLAGPTPLTTDDSGRVFGHIASWEVDHIGLPGGTRAPRSQSDYAYFHSGVVRTDDGSDKTVGQLTLAGGHADITATAAKAVQHYDDTGSAVADVHAGEDSFGIWVAGSLRPGTTPEQIRALRASAPSGDWRVISNRLEMVAVCQVNVPGFPITRAQVASGAVMALVAAGASTLARMKSDPVTELQARMDRIEAFERRQTEERALAARAKLTLALDQRRAEATERENLAAAAQARVFKVLDIDGYMTEFKDFSPAKREQLAKEKHALPDGSFPIENTADLRRAVHAYGRAEESKKAKVRRHVVRRARALGKESMVPKDWTENSLNDMALSARDSRETLTAAAQERRAAEAVRRVREV